jgi:hypothetical protein
MRSSGRGLPPWRMVHGQPVNAGYDTAGDDGNASAGAVNFSALAQKRW